MSLSLKRNKYLALFSSLLHQDIKFQSPLILRMYGLLNDLNLKKENRYILCNFIDQNSDLFSIKADIYRNNHKYTLNQLFLFAIKKAKECNLIGALYEEYLNTIVAINQKKEISRF
ncbi:MAG: hypothetical protein EU531_03720 [Promethearchaeota archaeon]|nr:MAG: hypothetical protein EU531_03720 [Candidatus Lokiarchaeota archaeon]